MGFKLFVGLPSIISVSLRLCSAVTKDVLVVGASASIKKTISEEEVKTFCKLSGDWNPIHCQTDKPVVHGALLNGLVSGVIGTKLPGPGTLLLKESLRFPNPCFVGDSVVVTVELTDVRRLVSCKFNVTSESSNKVVMEGEATLLIKRN